MTWVIIAVVIFVAWYIIGWKRGWEFKQIMAAIACSWGLLLFFWLVSKWLSATVNILGGG